MCESCEELRVKLEQAREALIEILSCEDLHPDHIRMAYQALKQQEVGDGVH